MTTTPAGDELQQLMNNLDRMVRGSGPAKHHVLVAMLAEGHVLIEDVPGTGKTSLAKALADSIDGIGKRIQFTPDLLPSDVTGSQMFNQRINEFEFHAGPILANIVLADEINRASPKTQSSLLEVMEERQVTSDGETYPTPRPFVVIATQNPIEQEGTYRLPEAQLDRFLLRTHLGYLDHETEEAVLLALDTESGPTRLDPVLSASEVMDLIQLTKRVHLPPPVARYIVELAQATRVHPSIRLGVSTRGSTAMVRAARAHALLRRQRYVAPDDVKALLEPVFAHRILLTPEAEIRHVTVEAVLAEISASVNPPIARDA